MSSTPAQLRPLGVGEILDAGIKIYRSKFATMLKAVAVVIVPVQVPNVLITLSLPDTSTTAGATTTTSDSQWAGVAALLLIFVINVVSSALAEAACLKAVSDTYLGTETDWRGSLRFGFRRLGSLLWLTLIHGVLVLLGFAACIVPGVWLYVAWSVAVPVLLMEGTRGFRALGRGRGRGDAAFAVSGRAGRPRSGTRPGASDPRWPPLQARRRPPPPRGRDRVAGRASPSDRRLLLPHHRIVARQDRAWRRPRHRRRGGRAARRAPARRDGRSRPRRRVAASIARRARRPPPARARGGRRRAPW